MTTIGTAFLVPDYLPPRWPLEIVSNLRRSTNVIGSDAFLTTF